MTKNEIIKKASDICRKNNIVSYPVNIVDLCSQYDIKVFEEYLPSDVSGFIVVQNDNFSKYNHKKVIVVNLSHVATRRRFTIAHEFAHFILHKDPNKELYAHRDVGHQYEGIEREANIFAANVLMPKDLVSEAIEDLKSNYLGNVYESDMIYHISTEFAVSKDAAAVRLNQLNYIK